MGHQEEKEAKLIRPSNFEQFGQGVSEKPIEPHPRCFKGSYETNENTQNDTQTTPKWNQTKFGTHFNKQQK